MLTLTLLLVLAAFVVTVASAIGKAPLWIAVMLLCMIHLLSVVPIQNETGTARSRSVGSKHSGR